MAMALSQDQPADGKWNHISPNYLGVETMGKFAVAEYDKMSCGANLTYVDVFDAWQLILAEDFGNLYLLHLHATNMADHITSKYQAFVWKKPDSSPPCPGPCRKMVLVSFQPLGSALPHAV